MRVAIGGIHTECSSYSPLQQSVADFTRLEGQALLDMAGVDGTWAGVTAIPIFHDRSTPGGPVPLDLYLAQRDAFMAGVRAAMPLDGVLLIMHGAYFVPGLDDPEGDFVSTLRAIVGPNCIIASAWDLHGQATQAITDTVDIFTAFRTAPHVDQAQTRARAAHLMLDALRGGPRPRVVRHAVPLLVSGEMSSTFAEPCASLYAALAGHDARAGVLDANLMIGYVWADSPRATAAAVVTCTDEAAGRASAAEIARGYWNARDALLPEMESAPLPALLDRLTLPAVLSDSGDNPGAGGVADRADVLAELLARGWGAVHGRRAVLAIAAPGAVAALQAGEAKVLVGGQLGGGGPVAMMDADVVRVVGDDAVVVQGGLTVILTSGRRPFHRPGDFAALGLDTDSFDLIVTKCGYLSPEMRALPRRQVMALTDGAVCQNLIAQENLHRPRPTWPFQKNGPGPV